MSTIIAKGIKANKSESNLRVDENNNYKNDDTRYKNK